MRTLAALFALLVAMLSSAPVLADALQPASTACTARRGVRVRAYRRRSGVYVAPHVRRYPTRRRGR